MPHRQPRKRTQRGELRWKESWSSRYAEQIRLSIIGAVIVVIMVAVFLVTALRS